MKAWARWPGKFSIGALAAFGLVLAGSADSSSARPSTGEGTPRAGPCSEGCDRRAADCLESCEAKFKEDDKSRIACKVACATERQKCDQDCK